jgi:D-arabinose 1-dehydrogenase-like Zn-dependent alcohol dehydrogenase
MEPTRIKKTSSTKQSTEICYLISKTINHDTTKAYAAQAPTTPLTPFNFERRDPGPHDVQIEILFCGVCHSDIHQVRNEWGGSIYPMVPGHEIVGRVTKTGDHVKILKLAIWPAWVVL